MTAAPVPRGISVQLWKWRLEEGWFEEVAEVGNFDFGKERQEATGVGQASGAHNHFRQA